MKKIVFLLAITMFSLIFTIQTNASSECPHEWEIASYKEPSCNYNGYRDKICKLCHTYNYEPIPATGKHVWGTWDIYREPTCGNKGERVRSCSICYKREYMDIPPTRLHNLCHWKTRKKATKFSTGIQWRYCFECDCEELKTIPKLKASKKEEALMKAVDNYISAARKYNVTKMNNCFIKHPKDTFFGRKHYFSSYCRKYNAKISYKINNISIKGKKAKIIARVTSPNAYDYFFEGFEDTITFLTKHPNTPTKTVNEYLQKRVRYYTKKYAHWGGMDYSTSTITFTYLKTTTGWKIQVPTTAIIDIANCRYEKAYRDYF